MSFTGTVGTPPPGPRSTFISGRNLGRIGTAMLLLGLVFLYRWGVTQGWINELARVGAGGFLSLGLLGAGLYVSSRREVFSSLLEGAGLAGLFMTAFAAHRVYGLVDETGAFLQLIAVSALAIGLAMGQRREAMAVIGAVGAFSAPLLIGGHIEMGLGDAGYLILVLLTIGVILALTGWETLFAVAVASTTLITLAELAGDLWNPLDATRVELVALFGAAALGLYGGPVTHAFLAGPDARPVTPLVSSAIVTLAAFAGGLVSWGADQDPIAWALVAVGLAAVHSTVAATAPDHIAGFRRLQLLPAVTFLALAAALALDGAVLLFVWGAQATGLILAGRRDETGIAQVVGGVGYGLVAVVMLTRLAVPTTGLPVLNGDAIAHLGVVLLAFVIAASMERETKDQQAARAAVHFFAYLALLAWQYAELARLPEGQAAISAGWAITGLALVVGAWQRYPVVRNVGLATLLVTVAKLFLVDLAAVGTGWRIVLFMGMGGVLLGLGYVLAGSEEDEASPTPGESEPIDRPGSPWAKEPAEQDSPIS